MDDPAKVVIALGFFGTVVFAIKAIAGAAVAAVREKARLSDEVAPHATEARLARIEQAVDAIAVEIERISEGQRFTTKLLSDNKQLLPKPERRELSTNTPT
jgi:hypothetical protein